MPVRQACGKNALDDNLALRSQARTHHIATSANDPDHIFSTQLRKSTDSEFPSSTSPLQSKHCNDPGTPTLFCTIAVLEFNLEQTRPPAFPGHSTSTNTSPSTQFEAVQFYAVQSDSVSFSTRTHAAPELSNGYSSVLTWYSCPLLVVRARAVACPVDMGWGTQWAMSGSGPSHFSARDNGRNDFVTAGIPSMIDCAHLGYWRRSTVGLCLDLCFEMRVT